MIKREILLLSPSEIPYLEDVYGVPSMYYFDENDPSIIHLWPKQLKQPNLKIFWKKELNEDNKPGEFVGINTHGISLREISDYISPIPDITLNPEDIEEVATYLHANPQIRNFTLWQRFKNWIRQ